MKAVQLGELMVSRGGSLDPKRFPDETFELFSIPAFDRGETEVLFGSEIGSTKQFVQPADVMLSKIVPHIRRAWVVPEERGYRQIASGEWILLRGPDFDGAYLRHVLTSDVFNADFMQTVAGVGGSLLRARPAHVAKIRIPLPQLDEQRRIAAILDRADELRTKRRQALAHLDTLTQSIFQEMFGDLRTTVKWPRVAIGQASSTIVDCVNRTAPLAAEPTEFKMIRTSNVRSRTIDLDKVRYVEEETFERWNRRATPQMGDVVLTREAPMGEAGMITTPDRVFLGQRTMLYRPDASKLESSYLLYFLTSDFMRDEYFKNGSGSTVKHLSVPYCRSFEIFLPPIELQQTFATRIAAVERLKESHRKHLADLDALFASLQHRAFKGEL